MHLRLVFSDVHPQAHYILLVNCIQMNSKAMEFIEELTRNADKVQTRVLTEILSRSAHVEYLTAHNLQGRTDRESFKKVVPVVTYEDIAPYTQRIANGDTSPILCSQPITEFFLSSGTSGGTCKMIPAIEEGRGRTSLLYSLQMQLMNHFIPGLESGKGMYFFFIRSESTTPGGLLARPIATSFLKNQNNDHYKNYTSPIETILCLESFQSMYSQVLCGLAQQAQVVRVGTIFASGLILVIKFLEQHWELLCDDIRTGFPNPTIVIDPAVQEAVKRVLGGPNPGLEGFIEAECRKEDWQGIIGRLWPNTKYIDSIVTGTMTQYIPMLDYYSGGLPLVCMNYGSSEGYFGINLNPLCDPSEVAYTIFPNMAYFEFLPSNREGGQKEMKLVDLVDVELGKEYELVITTYAGLYRYQMGDILRVAGFRNKTPQFNFVCRKNVFLSVDADKTSEVDLQHAVTAAVNDHLLPLDATLIDYTSCVDATTVPGHYVLFWEIGKQRTSVVSDSVLEDCCLTIEESLNNVYRLCRVTDNSIGPLEIRVVETGTFDKLMDYKVTHGASIGQYKTQRSVKDAPTIQLLNSSVVSKCFSRECPKWLPHHMINSRATTG